MTLPNDLTLHGADRAYVVAAGRRMLLGRTSQCDIAIDDPSVSRRHCALHLRDGVLHVEDLESANGTFVNEARVSRAEVRPGDRLRCGATVFSVGEAAPQAGGPVVTHDASRVEPVIERRIEPSSLTWMAPAEIRGPAFDLLQRAQRHLTTLHRTSELLADARDLQGLGDAALQTILEVLPADRAALVLCRDGEPSSRAQVAQVRARTATAQAFNVSRTLVGNVIDQGVSVFAHDAATDERFGTASSVMEQHVHSVMCVPLRTTDRVIGALYVDSLSGAGRFSDADLELLAAIGNQAGVAIHRARLMGDLEHLLLDTIRAIAATVDARDGYTHRHSERVSALSRSLAIELGLPGDVVETVELSALLHDVGKIAVPDAILNKPGRLTEEEFAQMRQHPEHGARILGKIQSAAVTAILPGVRHHHERWDGTGYPDGLSGEAIPLLGRILGVADVFDALTSTRSYRSATPPREAINLIREGAGTHFDPRIATTAARLFERGGWTAQPVPNLPDADARTQLS